MVLVDFWLKHIVLFLGKHYQVISKFSLKNKPRAVGIFRHKYKSNDTILTHLIGPTIS